MTTSKMAGVPPSSISDGISSYTSSSVTANPVNNWYWHMYANCIDEGSTSGAFVHVELDQYVIFSNRDVLLPS